MNRYTNAFLLALVLGLFVPELARSQAPFSGPTNYEVGSPNWTGTADVDNDGDQDIVAVSHSFTRGDFSFSVMFNDGAGQFPVSQKTPTPFMSASGELFDMDNDGDIDLALPTCCYSSQDYIYLLTNDGAGTFSVCGSLPIPFIPGGAESGDFDGDGDQDIAVPIWYNGVGQSGVVVFSNLGNCTFSSGVTNPIGTGSPVSPFRAVDLDGDLDLDLAGPNRFAGEVTILINNGAGAFAVGGSFPTGPGPGTIDAADFGHDGSVDLVVTRGSSDANVDSITVLDNDGSGNFPSRRDYEARFMPWGCVGDFNLDGWMDLATSNYDSRDMSIFLNDRAGGFQTRVDYDLSFPGPFLEGPTWICAGDLDNDGDADLAIPHDMPVQVMQNLNCGLMLPPCPFHAEDVNCDGSVDVLDVTTTVAVAFRGGIPRTPPCCLYW